MTFNRVLGSPGTDHFHGCHHVGGHDRVHLRPELIFQRRIDPVGVCPGCSPVLPCLALAGYFFWFFKLAATPLIGRLAICLLSHTDHMLLIISICHSLFVIASPRSAMRPSCLHCTSSCYTISANNTVVLHLCPFACAVQAATCNTQGNCLYVPCLPCHASVQEKTVPVTRSGCGTRQPSRRSALRLSCSALCCTTRGTGACSSSRKASEFCCLCILGALARG